MAMSVLAMRVGVVGASASCASSSKTHPVRRLARVPRRHTTGRTNAADGTFQGMPGPSKDDSPSEIDRLRAEVAKLQSELATERTAKTMIENQLRACVNEVSKILAAKRELEMELADMQDERK